MCNVKKTIRIIYLSDNDLKYIPMNIKNFHNLEILSVRDNDIESIPDSIESLSKIHELHLQVKIRDPWIQISFGPGPYCIFREICLACYRQNLDDSRIILLAKSVF